MLWIYIVLAAIFAVYIFAEADLSAKNREILHHTKVSRYMVYSLSRVSVIEEVAGFDVSVDDMVRVDVAQGSEQRSHVALHLRRSHHVEVVLK